MPPKYASNSGRGRRRYATNRRGGRTRPPAPPPQPLQNPISTGPPPPLNHPPQPTGPQPTPYAKKIRHPPPLPRYRKPLRPPKKIRYLPLSSLPSHLSQFPINKHPSYTPTEPRTILPRTDAESWNIFQEEEIHRLVLLRGFRARELVDWGAYPDLGAEDSVLSNGVQ